MQRKVESGAHGNGEVGLVRAVMRTAMSRILLTAIKHITSLISPLFLSLSLHLSLTHSHIHIYIHMHTRIRRACAGLLNY